MQQMTERLLWNWQLRDWGAAVVSSSAEFLICLGALAALWVSYVVRTVRRERLRACL